MSTPTNPTSTKSTMSNRCNWQSALKGTRFEDLLLKSQQKEVVICCQRSFKDASKLKQHLKSDIHFKEIYKLFDTNGLQPPCSRAEQQQQTRKRARLDDNCVPMRAVTRARIDDNEDSSAVPQSQSVE